MFTSSELEKKILINLQQEIQYFRDEKKESKILKWFKLKGIDSPIESHSAFKYNVHFIGKKEDPKYTGYGLIIYPSEEPFKKCYIGQFERGRRHGKGLRIMNDTIFDGNYKRDFKHGSAKVWKAKKSTFEKVFEGTYSEGKMHGKCYIKDDEHLFEGYVFKGLYHGKCRIKYKNGDTFEGSMVKGEMSGKAKIKYANGDIYEGGMLNNLRAGEGNYHWNQSNISLNFSSNLSTTKTSESNILEKKPEEKWKWNFSKKRKADELN
jgi:hypothetical protein